MTKACVFGCLDTKAEFLYHSAQLLRTAGYEVVLLDIGSRKYPINDNFDVVEAFGPDEKQQFENTRSSEAVDMLKNRACEKLNELNDKHSFDIFFCAGGSNGSTIALEALSAISQPCMKVCVSTVAMFLPEAKDIELIPSITDIIGLNSLLSAIAAYAIAVATKQRQPIHQVIPDQSVGRVEWLKSVMNFVRTVADIRKIKRNRSDKIVGITMFGVTTPCVEHCVNVLTKLDYECMVFHAVGLAGGVVMAKFIRSGIIRGGVLDITTTEAADMLCGGILGAPKGRFLAAIEMGIPVVMAPGAIDVINYKFEHVPLDRQMNPSVPWSPFTLSRTTKEDNINIAKFLADVANRAPESRFHMIIPRTFSKLSEPDEKFHLPEADTAFLRSFEENYEGDSMKLYAGSINDAEFAREVVSELLSMKKEQDQAANNDTMTVKLEERGGSTHRSSVVEGPIINQYTIGQLSESNRSGDILSAYRKTISEGRLIVGAGAGSGLAARALEQGGADMLIVYNSGYFRSHGIGSLSGLMPFENANKLSFEVGSYVLSAVEKVPVICGLCAQDPLFWTNKTLAKAAEMGFGGIQNFPTVGLIDADSYFRAGLEETGLGFEKEVKMIAEAVKMGLLTTPYIFTVSEAEQMAGTGTSTVVIHLGLTVSSLGGKSCRYTLQTSVPFVQSMVEAIQAVNNDCIILVHGGPVNSLEDFKMIASRVPGVHGFYGASTFERNPPYEAMQHAMRRFKKKS